MDKDDFILIIAILGILCIIILFYSLIAGIWGFNPTDISWFNTKLAITSIIGIYIFSGILND